MTISRPNPSISEMVVIPVLVFSFSISVGFESHATEYRAAEVTPPRSVEEIESTLSNASNHILFIRGPVAKAIDEWRKTKRPFLRDGHVQVNFRTMDFRDDKINISKTKAWAAPGEIAYRSGKFRGFLTVGASVYGSFKLSGNENAGGSGLLQLNGDNITTLGQAYLEFNWKGLIGRVYRQTLDLPYLNRDDIRMIPNTFEAYAIGRKNSTFDFMVGYVDKFKRRNSEDFISMGEAAGVDGSDTGTRVAAVQWKPPETDFEWGATLQRTPDIIELFYTEANWTRVRWGWGIRGAVQYTRQKGIGRDLLGDFKTDQIGLQLSTSFRNAVLGIALTKTDDGASINSPFGGKPGFTTSMLRDFDQANEKAFRFSLSWHFDAIGLPDLSANIRHTRGKNALNTDSLITLGDNRETDYTLDYKPESGRLQGLWFRVRYAELREEDAGKIEKQLMIILKYHLSIL